MANSTDDQKENISVAPEVTIDSNPENAVQPDSTTDQTVTSDRTEEVPALLGGSQSSDDVEPDMALNQDAPPVDNLPAEKMHTEEEPAAEPLQDQPEPEIPAEAAHTTVADPVTKDDLKTIMDSLQDSLTNTQCISSKIDAVINDTDCLIKQVNGLSSKYELLTAEMESSAGANTKNILSKTFLTISSLIVSLLFIFQIYMFISQTTMQRLQNTTGSAVLGNMSSLNKKMAAYDKNLAKALEHPTQQEHAQLNPAVTEKTSHEPSGHAEVAAASTTPVLEKLNKLRNGLPEKKLIRKETGDWFVYNKKSEECISDIDIIEALNQAYKKIGRTLSPKIPMPAHNALCILKPDGHGGTEIVMTKNFLP
jgi:hypothetical protein